MNSTNSVLFTILLYINGGFRKITFDDEFMHLNPEDGNDFVYLLVFSGSAKSILFPARYTADNIFLLCRFAFAHSEYGTPNERRT